MKVEQRIWSEEEGWSSISSGDLSNRAGLVFIFGERSLLENPERFGEIKERYPDACLIGCSTSGDIIGTRVLDDTLIVTAVSFEDTGLAAARTSVAGMADSYEAGRRLGDGLPRAGLVHVFILSDGLHVNGSQLVRGLLKSLPEGMVVTGGLAGDQDLFQKTLVIADGPPSERALAAIGFYGDRIKIGYGSMGGWDNFGVDRLVTRSEGNILYELDGAPALDLYKKYLGDRAKGLPATALFFPLSIRRDDYKTGLVRTILAVDEEKGSLTFAGDIPEGEYVRLMKANLERLIDGAAGAAHISHQPISTGEVELAILISCVGRKLVFKQRVEEEVEVVRNVLGEAAALAGFYSYGELCPPRHTETESELHNQTMTITTFAE